MGKKKVAAKSTKPPEPAKAEEKKDTQVLPSKEQTLFKAIAVSVCAAMQCQCGARSVMYVC